MIISSCKFPVSLNGWEFAPGQSPDYNRRPGNQFMWPTHSTRLTGVELCRIIGITWDIRTGTRGWNRALEERLNRALEEQKKPRQVEWNWSFWMKGKKQGIKAISYYPSPIKEILFSFPNKNYVSFSQRVNRDQWKEMGCFVPINRIYIASFPPGINSAFD